MTLQSTREREREREPSLHTHRVRSSIQAIVWLSLHNSVILLECAPARTHNLILAFAISRILTALAGQLPIFGLKYIRPSKHSTKDSAHDQTHAVASSQRSFERFAPETLTYLAVHFVHVRPRCQSHQTATTEWYSKSEFYHTLMPTNGFSTAKY